MKKLPVKTFFFTLLFLTTFRLSTNAQANSKNVNYSKHPYWIEMINDPNVNYFEAIKAYETFWQHRKKPMEENEMIGQDKRSSEKETVFQRWFGSKRKREEAENRKYALDVKKFEHWKMMVKPYVQEDGSILSAEERLKLWKEGKK